MQTLLKFEEIKKSYGNLQAVDGVSFSVNEGEIFGLIGPDGAGKTSLMRMAVSLMRPDGGRLFFMEHDVADSNRFVRSRVGYMPQRFSLYQDLTVEENLLFFGDLFKVDAGQRKKRLDELYSFSKLGPFKERRAGNLSGGMKQKLALSCMLMHEPRVMVLDEPTFGVDPVSRREFWDILQNLRDRGMALLVSTPYMDEAALCDRVGLMHKGQLLACDTPKAIITGFGPVVYRVSADEPHALYHKLLPDFGAKNVQLFYGGVVLIDRDDKGSDKLRPRLESYSDYYTSIEKIEPDLENIFLDRMRHDG